MKRLAKSLIRSMVHTSLIPLEARLMKRNGRSARWPHVFVTGAPRSGTSLFYELLVTRYRFAYVSNLADWFPKTPVAITWLLRNKIIRRESKYRSDYGKISGPSAPSEAGLLWTNWEAHGDWANESILEDLPAQKMRSTLAAISNVLEAPFVNKNVMHANRIRLLDALFPDCLFIEVRRPPRDAARSIIRAQRADKGPRPKEDGWWSVRPRGADGANVLEQACQQVVGVALDITRDTTALSRDCLHRVDYECLCADPDGTLSRVADFLQSHGVPIGSRAGIPASFDLQPSRLLTPEDEARLSQAFPYG